MSRTHKYQQIKHFKFWSENALQEGMQYESALFQRICTLNYGQRRQLYQQAAHLARQGADTIITYNDKDCHLWLNLRSK